MSVNLIYERIIQSNQLRVKETISDQEHRSLTTQRWKIVNSLEFRKEYDKFTQITVNTPTHKNAIIFDVDNPVAFQEPTITSSWVTKNKNNDKYHIGYLLKEPFITKTDKQKEYYRTTIKSTLTKIAWIIGADGNYQNTATKNPFNHGAYKIQDNDIMLSNIWDLLGKYNDEVKTLKEIETNNKKDGRYLSSKYKVALAEFIEHSQLNTKLLFHDRKNFDLVMDIKAELLADNIKELSLEDSKSICKDVIAYSKEWADKVSDIQSKRSKIANAKRWGDTVQQNKQNITAAMQDITSRGFKPTIKNISLCVNLSVSTLKRYYAAHIKEIKKSFIV